MTQLKSQGAGKALTGAIALVLLLAGCEGGNVDLGGLGAGGFNLPNNTVAGTKIPPRPEADSRGLITYPTYQVVEARQGDTVGDVASRLGIGAPALARHNGLKTNSRLRAGELLALPQPVSAGTVTDIASIASSAIDAAGKKPGAALPSPKINQRLFLSKPTVEVLPAGQSGTTGTPTLKPASKPASNAIEPIRHRVERGETAYSIARLYAVSVTALARWNRLGPDLAVREGQQLLIPIVPTHSPDLVDNSKPGKGSVTPVPPSASKPLPKTVKAAPIPASPDLKKFKTKTAPAKFLRPVNGKIISKYTGTNGGNDGIDIGAVPGTAVKAAADGEVALISKSVGTNIIVLLRHPDNIYTVYSNITDVRVTKGQTVQRGQLLGKVMDTSPSYLHFEVRRGTRSVNPMPYLK